MGGYVVDDSTFRLLLDLETKKAQRLRYPIAVVCLGMDGRNIIADTLAKTVAGAIRVTDVVACRNTHSVALLLIDAEADNLPVIVDRLTSVFDSAWSSGGACYPDSAATAEKLIHHATMLQQLAKEDGGRRLYVALSDSRRPDVNDG